MITPKKALHRRLEQLEAHLKAEHPGLHPVLPTFRTFDRLLYRLGLLDHAESLATRIPWWPMISVLGLFSSGKSSFINSYLGTPLQSTGNQAVDDRFTMICFGPERRYDALPGTALNADPRFPFYRISDEVEKVAAGEGKRIDAYLQLKTSPSARIKGKIIVDSPGFDADDQRRSTLRLVDHIIDLSDLVLVFFDARRPEPGSMHDTLEHLVSKTVMRSDSRKFLYILNQIDTSAREDNPEEIVGAWQRAVAQAGLMSGKFYGIYNRDVAPSIEDPVKRARYEAKCAEDLAEIEARIDEVEFGRGYRIVGILDVLATELEDEIIPTLQKARARWRSAVLRGDLVFAALVLALTGGLGWLVGPESLAQLAHWLSAERPDWLGGYPVRLVAVGAGLVALLALGHLWVRTLAARGVKRTLPERVGLLDLNLHRAFDANTRPLVSVFGDRPVGWGRRMQHELFMIREAMARHVQRWNDAYTDPTGSRKLAAPKVSPPPSVPKPAPQQAGQPAAAAPGNGVADKVRDLTQAR